MQDEGKTNSCLVTVCDVCKYQNKYQSILKTVTYVTWQRWQQQRRWQQQQWRWRQWWQKQRWWWTPPPQDVMVKVRPCWQLARGWRRVTNLGGNQLIVVCVYACCHPIAAIALLPSPLPVRRWGTMWSDQQKRDTWEALVSSLAFHFSSCKRGNVHLIDMMASNKNMRGDRNSTYYRNS